MFAAVARQTITGRQFDLSEAIDVRDALRSYTIGGAHAIGLASQRGSLEAGKVADLVQIDRNPLDVDAVDLRDTRVERTMLAGQWIYQHSA